MTLHVALASAGHPLAHAPTQSALPWWSFGKTVLAAAALALVRDGLLANGSQPAKPLSLNEAAGFYAEQATKFRAIAKSINLQAQ